MTFELKPGVNCERFAYVGSRVTCNPAPTDTDRDILVLCVEGESCDLIHKIFQAGGEPCGVLDYGDDMKPVRLGEDNFLLTEDEDYYQKFCELTSVVRYLNIMDKPTRHHVFSAMLDGAWSQVGGRIESVSRPVEVPF